MDSPMIWVLIIFMAALTWLRVTKNNGIRSWLDSPIVCWGHGVPLRYCDCGCGKLTCTECTKEGK